jgi:phosphate-selective porin OprO/OprP
MIYTTTWRSVALLRQVVVLLAFFCCSSTYSLSQAVPSSESTSSLSPSPEVESDSEAVRELLEQLTDRVKELETQQKANKSTAAKEEKPADSKVPPKDKWKVNLGGHMQLDSIFWADADPAIPETHNYTNFRRLRLVADGVGYDQYDFRLQMTLEPTSDTVSALSATGLIKDAYFTMNEIPLLGRFRIGHFFVPFSLEQVTNDTNNIFLERSIPTQTVFAADRELGMAVYQSAWDERLTLSSGIFVDSVSESTKKKIDDNQGYRLSGRLTYLPYYDDASDGRLLVHTGLGVLHTDDSDDIVRFRSRPQINEGPRIIDSGALDADRYTTGNFEGAIVMGRVTFQSEAFLSSIAMNDGTEGTANGAYVHVSWFLTGENRRFEKFGQHGPQFGRNKPRENFSAKPGAWKPGAWELKARWSHLDLNNLQRGQYNDLSVGVNWYWSDRVRMMMDWIHPITSDDAIFGATESDIVGLRWDVNW